MLRRSTAFALSTISILALLLLAGHWMTAICFPFEVHTPNWQCDVVFAVLGLSFGIPVALYGFFAMESPWLEGTSVSVLAALIANGMSYFQPFWGGPTSMTNATSAVYYAVLPGIIGALAGFKLKAVLQNREKI